MDLTFVVAVQLESGTKRGLISLVLSSFTSGPCDLGDRRFKLFDPQVLISKVKIIVPSMESCRED